MPIFYLLDCSLSLVAFGQVRDEQLSASSELPNFHAAKGRLSLIILSDKRYRAADSKARFNCNQCRTKKSLQEAKIDFSDIIKCV